MSESEIASAVTRRRCLQSTVAAGGLVIPAALSARAFAAGSDEIKVGLVGCGGRGTGAIRGDRDHARER